MKQCAIFVCYRNGPRHPLVDDAAHATGTKLSVLTHGVAMVKGAPILGKNIREMLKRNVRNTVTQTKDENNEWTPIKQMNATNDITLMQTTEMLMGEWVRKLRMPPDAFEAWLVPINHDGSLDKAKATCFRHTRNAKHERKFVPTLNQAALPAHVVV